MAICAEIKMKNIFKFTFSASIKIELLQYKMQKNFQILQYQKLKKTSCQSRKELVSLRKECIHLRKKNSINSIIFYLAFMMLMATTRSQDFTNNLIVNGNFSQPSLNGAEYQFFPFQIVGWSCTQLCEIKDCEKVRDYWLALQLFDSGCFGFAIDLNSNSNNEVVTQRVDLKAGRYLLHFNYYYPGFSSNQKHMRVTLNNKILLYVSPQVDSSFDTFQYEQVVQANQGPNVLAFENLGINDGTGFNLNNVSLYRMVDNDVLDWLDILSAKFSNINVCPGFRVVFRNILSFLVNFDRLELYIYHKRRYSYNAQLLLVAVNKFLDVKSNAAIGIISLLNSDVKEIEKTFQNQLQFKRGYQSYPSFSDDYKESTYLNNLNQSLVYFLPFVMLVIITLNILFAISFHSPISLAFRRFSLWAIALIMIFDGNIETLTFFTLTEFKTHFSSCFKHKILNVFIAFIFFLLTFVVFGLLHWGKFHYKKKVKFLLDEQGSKLTVIWGIVIDRGIICFLFGLVHGLLLDIPSIQLILLFFMEISWMVKKLAYIRKGLCNQKFLVITSLLSGCVRVFFQISCLIYESHPDSRIYINEVVHACLIYTIMGLSFLQLAVGCAYSFRGIWKLFIKKVNKVIDSSYHQNRLIKRQVNPNNLKKYVKIKYAKSKYKQEGRRQPKQPLMNQKVHQKRISQSLNHKIKGADFYLRRKQGKVTVANVAFQTV